jgi:hypothetical protein
MAFALVQILFWISLSTWFGGVLFIAVAAPIIFRTVKQSNPILPTVLSVNLEGQHASLLAGTIVANLLNQLAYVELICAGGVLIGLVGQWLVTDIAGNHWLLPMLRSAMYLAAVAVVLYDSRFLWPRILKQRDTYIEHADEPDVANPAKDEFDRLHRESVNLLFVRVALLLAMILFSGSITPRRAALPFPSAQASAAVHQNAPQPQPQPQPSSC